MIFSRSHCLPTDTENVSFLLGRFDCPWTHSPHLLDGNRRLHAEFDQEPSADRASSSQSAAAMNQNIASAGQQFPELITGHCPLSLEPFVRRRDIDDREVEPQHPSGNDLRTEGFHPEEG
jgi:hypothetical protein